MNEGLKYLVHPQTKETILIVTLHGANRDPRVLEWHKKVMVDHFQIPVNYIQCPFEMGVSHGYCMNAMLRGLVREPTPPTYVAFCDNDNIILRREAIDSMYQSVSNKITVYGCAWQSTHKTAKPNGTNQHAYAGSPCLCFPLSLYQALGLPDCDHFNSRSDTAEEITFEAQLRGYQVSLLYPSFSDTKTTQLDNGCWYGRGNVYGNPGLWYHESRADLPDHAERFVAKCQEVLNCKS